MISSYLENILYTCLKCIDGMKKPEREYCFSKQRKFRFDFAYPNKKLAIEISGNIWHRGGHSSGKGLIRDAEKNNLAILEGWRVLIYTEWHINHALSSVLKQIKEAYYGSDNLQ